MAVQFSRGGLRKVYISLAHFRGLHVISRVLKPFSARMSCLAESQLVCLLKARMRWGGLHIVFGVFAVELILRMSGGGSVKS